MNILKALFFNDPLARFDLLRKIGKRILPQYRFKWPQMAWWDNDQFSQYLRKFGELDGMNTDRRWTLYQLMRLTAAVPGDTAECGVYKGMGSYLICKNNEQNTLYSRTHCMFDSFEGLSKPIANDGKYWTAGDLACGLAIAEKNLAECKNTRIYQGWIPDKFPEVETRKFAFVHIDVDLYEPSRHSLEFFYPRMHTGGIILCDDYGFTTCPGATRAMDEYLKDKPEQMIALCSGGGFFIKGCVTLK